VKNLSKFTMFCRFIGISLVALVMAAPAWAGVRWSDCLR
jgi:hypothetical protein